jgi:hypothetical protein
MFNYCNCSAPVHRIRKNLCKSIGFCSCNGRLLLEPYRNILPSSCKAWLARLFLHGSEQLQILSKYYFIFFIMHPIIISKYYAVKSENTFIDKEGVRYES